MTNQPRRARSTRAKSAIRGAVELYKPEPFVLVEDEGLSTREEVTARVFTPNKREEHLVRAYDEMLERVRKRTAPLTSTALDRYFQPK